MDKQNYEKLGYFPFHTVRDKQNELIKDFQASLENKQNFICHAPTGIGKTAAVMAPAVKYAKKHEKTIFFLTSRHTQHKIALETLKAMKEKFNLDLKVIDIVGRQWMCSQPNIDKLYSGEFYEYCKSLKEGDKCEFFLNTKNKNKLTTEAKSAISDLNKTISNSEEITKVCQRAKLCPYELSLSMAAKADVVIADYYYVFHPQISDLFLKKTNKDLNESIIIVDEAHNLPPRLMELATQRLTNANIKRAIKEARRYGFNSYIEALNHLDNIIKRLSYNLKAKEGLVSKQDFISKVNQEIDFTTLTEDLEECATEIRSEQRQSSMGSISNFLHNWQQHPETGFARIISKEKNRTGEIITLTNNCLDPAIISKDIVQKSTSTVLMSGTLNPPVMYRDVLGFEKTILKTYPCPFPKENKLNLIVPKTSTKFSKRSFSMYQTIAQECAGIANNVPGNTIIFFPSYYLRDCVAQYFEKIIRKSCLYEQPGMTVEQRNQVLEKFKQYQNIGAVLLGVTSGNFYEGIDLPGDLLKAVIITGLPFQQPDLKTKELIAYYDKKYNKGWDYGYVFPAFNKTLQSAGRCIRSENDKGAVVYLDERYAWTNYKKIFPEQETLKIVMKPDELVKKFFEPKTTSLN
ncbi:MAG: ATP-dependent DNA helicase [Nanobdellota archaeon]